MRRRQRIRVLPTRSEEGNYPVVQSKIVLRSLAELAQLLDDMPPMQEAEADADATPADEQAVETDTAMLDMVSPG